MTPNETFLQRAQQEINQIADGLEYRAVQRSKLMSDHLVAMKRLCVLRGDFEFLSQQHGNPDLVRRLEARELYLDATEKVYGLFVYFAAVVQVTSVEIVRRVVDSNGANRNFGLLKIGNDRNIPGLQGTSYRQLEKLALSIPREKGWHHPDGPEEWISKFNVVLAGELEKHKALGPIATFAWMLDNRFAYIYQAFKNGFKDELRKLYSRHDRLPDNRVELEEISDLIPAPVQSEGSGLDRLGRIKFIEMAGDRIELPGGKAVLLEAARMLKDDPDSLIEKHDRHIRALLVKGAAQRAGVSEEQARKYVRKLQATKDSPLLSDVRKMLREGR